MEPWDGPACVTFTDGTLIGAVLDRNGLRPGRYWVTEDGLVVLASEVGVLDLDPASVVRKGRLQPGRMFLVDTERGRLVGDDEVKAELAAQNPYEEWLHAGLIHLADLPEREHIVHTPASVARRQRTFGYTEEELRILVSPMARAGAEPIGSMGTDTPVAVLSQRPRLLFDYFTQLFAQVTNPPLDAIREELVTSLGTVIGPEVNALDATPAHCRQLVLPFPVIDNDELAKIVHINADGDLPGYATTVVKGLYDVGRRRRRAADAAARDLRGGLAGDRGGRPVRGAVRPRLRPRPRADPVAAADLRRAPPPDPGQDPHPGRPAGRGRRRPRGAPRRAADRLRRGRGQPVPGDGVGRGPRAQRACSGDVSPDAAVRNLIKALGKGVLKVMSKMGISTVASYRGAQVFEAIGLSRTSSTSSSPGRRPSSAASAWTSSPQETALRHASAYPADGVRPAHRRLEVGGEYQWRREGEPHLFDPETVFRLQHATRARRFDVFRQYTAPGQRPVRAADDAARAARAAPGRRRAGDRSRPSRSTRSSRSARSSSGSPPAR